MLRHVVFFKLKDPSPEALAQSKRRLESLYGQIPELLAIEVGINVVPSARAYDIALYSTFESVETMQAYQVHPVHKEFAAYMSARSESVVAVDYEV